MIETTCKINLKTVDYIEVECANCKSRVQTKTLINSRCPNCGCNYDSKVVDTVNFILSNMLKLKEIDTNVSFIKVER
ncbi:hypothetical protein [Hydrogenimonas thermophila]|uniref:Uncharacterized protein n=1 Tax=Hydrogenimonas thermophila TaxID=223786 RepID=A0A1I5RR72_9BACT|nr:hypothetical protein [Hydrogenimonas thermophila]SFP60910.1 hypothetical protein SAMN05216234_12823 [Hydrogenimonas thermophila]